MTGAALALVLAAAVCHAAWNLVAKTTGGGNAFVLIGSLLVTVLWAPLVLWIGVQEVGDWGFVEWGVLLATAVVQAAPPVYAGTVGTLSQPLGVGSIT